MRFLPLSLLLISLSVARMAYADSFTVSSLDDTGGGTLREAITEANGAKDASTITFAAGLSGTVALQRDLPDIVKDVTISASNNITLDGQNIVRIFLVNGGTLRLSGLTLANGSSTDGGGALFVGSGTATASQCTFSGNAGGFYGGAIFNSGNAAVVGCTFTGNTARASGGAIFSNAFLSLSNSTFSGNSLPSGGQGGAIYNSGFLIISTSTVVGNQAGTGVGGGLYSNGNLIANNSIFAGNSDGGNGPDFFGNAAVGDYNLVQNPTGAKLAGGSNITGQDPLVGPLANNGGPTQTCALLAGSPAIDAGNSTGADQRGRARAFDNPGVNNVVNGSDIGAVEQGSTVVVQSGLNYVVTNNTDTDDGACTPTDCSLREAANAANSDLNPNFISFDPTAFATPQTIAIGNDFPSLNTDVTLTGSPAGVTIDSSAKASGFPVTGGSVNLVNLTFTGNGNNFGVQNSGANLTVSGCTLTGNFNGLQLVAGSTLVQNSTFSGNTRGILATTNFTLSNSTVGNNFTGLYLNGATVTPTVSNSIVAGNNTNVSNNNGSSVTDGGHNLSGVTAAQAGLSPAGLQNHGGPTKTIALAPGSPALDGGDPAFDTSALLYDQRGIGYPRKSGTAIDIGALEAQVPTDLSLNRSTILEKQPSGTFIGSFSTTDADFHDSFTYSLATGTGDDDNASFSINAAGSLRSAAVFNFATKSSYSILVRTTDSSGLFFERQFTITVLEATPPAVTISTPTLNQKIALANFDNSVVTGIASDNVGVAAVKVRLSRKRSGVNQYWNGTSFTAVSAYLDAAVTGSTSATWQLTNVPVSNLLDKGLYQVEAYALDASGNKSATVARPFTLTVDSVPPTVSLNTPSSNQIVNINNFGAGTVTGVAGDDTGVVSVKVRIQRKRGAVYQYWNGTAFTTTSATVNATVSTVGGTAVTWSLDAAIPANQLDAGGYAVYATAYDAAGNFVTTPSRGFVVVGVAAAPVSAAGKSAGNS